MLKVAKNFHYYEFRPKGLSRSWMPKGEVQKMQVELLAVNLQLVRDYMPKDSSIKITSGVRDAADFTRLVKAGYNPSKTSDHNFSYAPSLKKGTRKFKKYGDTYNFAVGAADCVPSGIGVYKFFLLAVKLVEEGVCFFGQVIYEKNPKTGAEWVHFGNDPTFFYNKFLIEVFRHEKFLVSADGGKSYKIFKGKL